MKLFPSLQKRYTKERFTAVQAQRLAQEIAFGPIVFQVSRLMLKFGIFRLLSDNREGLSLEQISQNTGLSKVCSTSFTGSLTHHRYCIGKRRSIYTGKGRMVPVE